MDFKSSSIILMRMNYSDTLIDLMSEKLMQLMEPDSVLGRSMRAMFLVVPLSAFSEILTTESW